MKCPYFVIPLLILLCMGSCSEQIEPGQDKPPNPNKIPPKLVFNPPNGYTYNPFHKRKIAPTTSGQDKDTIQTGVPFPYEGLKRFTNRLPASIESMGPLESWEKIELHSNDRPRKTDDNFIWLKDMPPDTFNPHIVHSKFTPRNTNYKIQPTLQPIHVVPELRSLPLTGINSLLPSRKEDVFPTGFNKIGIQENSSNFLLHSLVVDSSANIWTASSGNSISKITTHYQQNFEHPRGELNDLYVFQDSKNNIWYASSHELICFDGNTFRSYSYPVPSSINMIYEDRKGHFWIGTNDAGVAKFDGDSFFYITSREGLESNMVYAITEDSAGKIWLGTGNGIMIWNEQYLLQISQNQGLQAKSILSIRVENDSSYWISSKEEGIQFVSGSKLFSVKSRPIDTNYTGNIQNQKVFGLVHSNKILEGNDSSRWISDNNGLSKIENHRVVSYNKTHQVASSYTSDIAMDKQRNLFTSTFYNGLYVMPPVLVDKLERKSADYSFWEDNHFEDQRGNIWISEWGTGIYVLKDESIYRNTDIVKTTELRPSDIGEDSQGNMWFYYRTDIVKYDGENVYRYTHGGEGVSQGMVVTPADKVLIIYPSGWVEYDKGLSSYIDFTFYDGSEDWKVRAVDFITEEDHYIFLKNGMLAKNQQDSLTFFSEREGLMFSKYNDHLFDKKGNVWISTEDGIQVIKDDFVYFITREQGLPETEVYQLAEDHSGNIWVSQVGSISVIKLKEDSPDLEIDKVLTFNDWNGLQGSEPGRNSFLIDKQNRLLFGNEKGTHILDINLLDFSTQPVLPQLISLDINAEFIDYRNIDDSLKKPMSFRDVQSFNNIPLELELNYNQNHLTFYYDAVDWSAPDRIQFSYRLLGQDESWSPPTKEAKVDYTNLSPGDYTFQLSAMGQNREWSKPLEYTFTILPPFWLSWYAFGIYAFVVFVVVYQYRKYLHEQALKKADYRIKAHELEKMKELDDHKSRFFTNVTHEFRTPLSLIQGTVDKLHEPGLNVGERKSNLQLLKRNSSRLSRLVNNLLEVARLEESKVKVNLNHCNVSSEILYHSAAYKSMSSSQQLAFQVNLPETDIQGYIDREKLEIILHNLLSNAFKYVGEFGQVELNVAEEEGSTLPFPLESTKYKGRCLRISVSDNGPGISSEKLQQIFDRFERDVQGGDYGEGMGVGLSLTKEIVHFLGGQITVNSKVNEGTEFVLCLPLEKEDYHQIDALEEELIDRFGEEEFSQKDLKREDCEGSPLIDISNTLLLIAEDNLDLRTFLKQNLSNEFKIILAENGKVAWNKCRQYVPDIIVTDLMMPEMNGLEFTQKVKEEELTCHIPVIMLTAKSGVENRIIGHQAGADDYLQKPFNLQELKAKMRNLIKQRFKLKQKYAHISEGVPGNGSDILAENKDKVFLEKIYRLIHEHLDDPQLKSEAFETALCMSRVQLYRKVKALTGEGLNVLIQSYRLNKAEQMLRNHAGNISEVAYACGFSNPSYFSSSFKRRYGVAPKEYVNG